MSFVNKFAAVAAQAAEVQDVKETTKGGGDFVDPLKDVKDGDLLMVRFRSYIEVGEHPGSAKFPKPRAKAMFDFEVVTPRFCINNEDGTQQRGRVGCDVNISTNEGGSYAKLFKAMDYGRGNNVFPQMLGELFLMKAHVNEVGEGDKKKRYINFVGKEFCSVMSPFTQDPITGESTRINGAELQAEAQCFLWDFPTQEQWDSIYIDGETDKGKSKNFIQEKILRAINFAGSPLAGFLESSGVDIAAALATANNPENAPEADETPEPEAKQHAAPNAAGVQNALAAL